jgi:hypothetical protein
MAFIILPGDRGYGVTQSGPDKNGCTLEFHGRAAAAYGDWRDFIAVYGFGGRDAPAAALGSFTLVVYITSTGKYEVYTGCRVNKAVIDAPGPGKLLEFSMQIFAQDHMPEAALAITDIQNVTIGAAPSEPTSSLLFWASNCQVNLGGAGLATQYFKKWTLSVDNHLDRIEGVKVWNDATKHQQTVEIHEGEREITFECTLAMKDSTWDLAKINKTAVTALTIPIDDDTITLSTGDIIPSDFSDRAQKQGEEKLTIRFPKNNLTIA